MFVNYLDFWCIDKILLCQKHLENPIYLEKPPGNFPAHNRSSVSLIHEILLLVHNRPNLISL